MASGDIMGWYPCQDDPTETRTIIKTGQRITMTPSQKSTKIEPQIEEQMQNAGQKIATKTHTLN